MIISSFLKHIFLVIALFYISFPAKGQTTEELQREFTNLRFGMFIHFSIRTFINVVWARPNEDTSKFDPTDLDCNQLAEAAATANMKFAILTTKHHHGFCLRYSKCTKNDVASTPWKNGKGTGVI